VEEIDSKNGELGDARTIRMVKLPRNVNGVYWRPQENSSDTILNIVKYIVETRRKREKREWKERMEYIVFSSIYYI
jgi:hypothetical protein